MNDRTYKIGEVSDKTGLTVRTIRYYHEIGLLEPAERNRSGYRLYGGEELERLHKICSLKSLGFQLDEIRDYLENPDFKLSRIIYRQMKQVRTEIELGRELYSRLQTIADLLGKGRELPAGELIKTINAMTMYEKYYTQEQLEYLEKRKEELGEDRNEEVQKEWKELIAEVRAEMEKGTDPESERMRQLAVRWESLIREFTGGDEGIRSSLERMYRTEGAEKASHSFVDGDVTGYMAKAQKRSNS